MSTSRGVLGLPFASGVVPEEDTSFVEYLGASCLSWYSLWPLQLGRLVTRPPRLGPLRPRLGALGLGHPEHDQMRYKTMPKTIYLANPYGFSTQQKALLLPMVVAALEELGLEVWEPFARNNQVDFSQAGWAYQIGQADFADVRNSDAIFAIVNGVPPDEGVMVELGMAIALGKPTFLFRDDFRRPL